MTIASLRRKREEALAALNVKRATAFDAFKAIAGKKDFKPADQPEYDRLKKAVEDIDVEIKATTDECDVEIKRLEDLAKLEAKDARPAAGQDIKVEVVGNIREKAWTDESAAQMLGLGTSKGLVLGGITKMIAVSGGAMYAARDMAKQFYGENHPVTKALLTSVATGAGFLVPPDVLTEIIPLLRAKAVVRSAGPRTLPMPRGTMTMPSQTSAATASYGAEGIKPTQTQQKVGQVTASFKKLKALVPVSNDMMRYADPAIDAFVRDDLVKVMALTEDLNFILGDGTKDSPRGYLSFANGWVGFNGGTVGVWSTSANSTLAVNGTDPANSTGGNFITSNPTYTLATVAQECGGAVNRLDAANVPEDKRVWFMNPRSFNYLNNVQNSLGVYVYRDELSKGTLLQYPVKKTTQIGTNYWDASGTNKDLSFVFLVEMTEDIILDSMQLELAVSREGSYVDSGGSQVNAFETDQTIIRAIAEHDHQMRHDAAVAVVQGVRWAPAIS